MKRLWQKKEYLAIGVVVLLFLVAGVVSRSSMHLLQGNARVVNYVGIVRGATQKLVKEEIMGWYLSRSDPSFNERVRWYPDDKLVTRLDSIVEELLTGRGENNLVVLADETYLSNMREVQAQWTLLKKRIDEVRGGASPEALFDESQSYFELANETVFSAETYSERQVDRINRIMIGINGVFIVFIVYAVGLYAHGLTVRRRAEVLNKIAYVDPLTQIDNRASCERLIARLENDPTPGNLAVFMFDMNDLKLTNDFLGHQGGDRTICAFGHILKAAAKDRFIGRFGGDEFLAIFEPGDETSAQAFLNEVRREVDRYNEVRTNRLERIQYAAGYVIESAAEKDIEDIIHEADNRMYENKRRLKKKI